MERTLEPGVGDRRGPRPGRRERPRRRGRPGSGREGRKGGATKIGLGRGPQGGKSSRSGTLSRAPSRNQPNTLGPRPRPSTTYQLLRPHGHDSFLFLFLLCLFLGLFSFYLTFRLPFCTAHRSLQPTLGRGERPTSRLPTTTIIARVYTAPRAAYLCLGAWDLALLRKPKKWQTFMLLYILLDNGILLMWCDFSFYHVFQLRFAMKLSRTCLRDASFGRLYKFKVKGVKFGLYL